MPRGFRIAFSRLRKGRDLRCQLSRSIAVQLRKEVSHLSAFRSRGGVSVGMVSCGSKGAGFSLVHICHKLRLRLIICVSTTVRVLQKRRPGGRVLPKKVLCCRVSSPMLRSSAPLSSRRTRRTLLFTLHPSKLIGSKRRVCHTVSRGFRKGSRVVPIRVGGGNRVSTTHSGITSARRFTIVAHCMRRRVQRYKRTVCTKGVTIGPCQDSVRADYACYPCNSIYKVSTGVPKCRCQRFTSVGGRRILSRVRARLTEGEKGRRQSSKVSRKATRHR